MGLAVSLASTLGFYCMATPLDDYVAQPDSNYGFTKIKTLPGEGYQVHILEMTSQAWLTEAEVDRPLWKHWLGIVEPDEVASSGSLLYISGGDNDDPPPDKADERFVKIAMATKSVVSVLGMIPNQPLVFAGESKGRKEDWLIAYCWDKFLHSQDPKWLPRLPMTKSAVRAMDAITEFCASSEGGEHEVNQFVVSGGSKRGWTTWTTAAVDPRVKGIIPIVIDMLNVVPSFKHHFDAYGFYAPAVGDYERMGIMAWQDTPEYQALIKIVEPYEYRDRLTMPKFIINATGDQFFLPDSWRFYFDELKGPKYIRYVPNADHSLRGSDAIKTLLSCYQATIDDLELPDYRWEQTADGTVRVHTPGIQPKEVKLWQASNPDARDFRLETIGPVWEESQVREAAHGVYEVQVPAPEKGWRAYLVELTYQLPGAAAPTKLTTGVYVTPDTLPHARTLR